MSDEPWIGDAATGVPRGTCTFGTDAGTPLCGQPAATHILSESAIHGHVALAACDRHTPIARTAGVYVAEHRYGPSCSADVTLWRDEGCESGEQMVADIENATPPPDLDGWLDGRDAWLAEGIARGYVCSEVRCATHDGEPLTPDEEAVFDEGYDDPCIPIVRLASEPGEPFIPRFGPPPDLN